MRVVLCIALTLTMPWHDRERITVQMLLKNANEQHVCTCDLMDMIDRLICMCCYSVIVQLLVKAANPRASAMQASLHRNARDRESMHDA